MELVTERLILRPWKISEAEIMYEYAKDPRVGPPAGWAPHESVEESREIIESVFSVPDTFAVCLKETGLPIGALGIEHEGYPDDEAEVGYWLGVPHWGKGLIPEAVREIQRYVFEEKGIETLWCAYFDGNTKSARVQEKCGFEFHHINEAVECPRIHEVRMEIFNVLTKEKYLKLKNTEE